MVIKLLHIIYNQMIYTAVALANYGLKLAKLILDDHLCKLDIAKQDDKIRTQ